MSFVRPQRGRPKGSGIDDRARLREIAALLASQPHIKPTTAIRMLGETDPSVIRRLRDKFYSVQQDLMSEMRSRIESAASVSASVAASAPAPLTSARLEATPQPSTRALALETYDSIRRQAPDRSAPVPGDEAATRERLVELAAYNVMLSHAIQATILAVQQTKGGEAAVKLPSITAILRQQITLGEAVMAMAWPRTAGAEAARPARA